MTESMTRKDGFELYDSERIYELELSLARKEALLREAQRLVEAIERELEGK
jgi:hypothetical protein